MKATRTDFELPERPVSNGEIAALEAELERRKAVLAQQDEEAAERGRQRAEAERLEQARKEAEEAASKRQRDIVDKAKAVPAASGAAHSQARWRSHYQKVVFDAPGELAPWSGVIVVAGPFTLPVVAVTGDVLTVVGPVLAQHRLASQLLTRTTAESFLPAYRLAAERAFLAGMSAEAERVVEPGACLLYCAGLPAVTVVEDEISAGLFRVVATWGDVFAYDLPPIGGPDAVHLCPDCAAELAA